MFEAEVLSIAVVGIGGCGCNNVKLLASQDKIDNCYFYAVNSDITSCVIDDVAYIQIGSEVCRGLGAGAKPVVGHAAAKESLTLVCDDVAKADVVILTAGLGGGTGSGALPVILKELKRRDKTCLVIVTLPFPFEGQVRASHAQTALASLKGLADGLQVLDNALLSKIYGKSCSLLDCFKHSNQSNVDCLAGLTSLLSDAGTINVDLNDFAQVLSSPGYISLGRWRKHVDELGDFTAALWLNPLSPYQNVEACNAAIIQVKAGAQFSLDCLHIIGEHLQSLISPHALVIVGYDIVESMGDYVDVFYLLNGLSNEAKVQLSSNYSDYYTPKVNSKY